MDGLPEGVGDDRSGFAGAVRQTDASQYGTLYDIALDASTSLMSAEPDEFETKLRWGLESVGSHVDADRGYVFQSRNERFERTAGWTDEEVDPWDVQHLALDGFEWLGGRLRQFENAVVPRVRDLPTTSALREALRAEEVESAVFLPMVEDWSLQGFVGFDLAESTRQWDEAEVDILRSVADMIAHSLSRVRREKLLKRQNERLETFASVISHDLRNPLNVVTGSLELADASGGSEHIDRATRAAERMEDLIEQVLALAQQGRDIGDTRRIRLGAVVESAWATVEAPAADIRLESDATVYADPDRLREAFENLFRNAVEHGGDDVTVRAGAVENGFYIEDDGAGIPEERRESVFDRGYTTDGGTGLGLPVVRSIVDAHGWSIRARDGVAGGARFEITDVEFAAT